MARWFLSLCAALVAAMPAYSLAEEEATAHIARLLNVGWGTTTSFRTAADAQAEQMFAAAGRQPTALQAAALVQIKQRRYVEAAKLIDEILARDEGNLPAWRAKIWLQAVLKKYDGVMVSADKLSQLLPEDDAKTAEEEALIRPYVAFLGRIYGFLGGPAQSAVRIDGRKESERVVTARLTENRLNVFAEARDGVLQKFVELTDAKENFKDKAKEQADADREKTLAEVAELRDVNKERVKELEARVDKHKKEYEGEASAIRRADAPLQSELNRLSSRATTLNTQLFSIDSQIASLQAQLSSTKDPNIRAILIADIDRLSIIEGSTQAELLGLNRQAAGVQQQRSALAVRQQRADADLADKLGRVDDELASIAKKEKRADIAEKRATKATPMTPQSALSLSAQAAALITYDPFPLEQEKSRLLESLRR
jgi:hypothetical protein